MRGIYIKFDLVGECTIDVAKVVKKWDNKPDNNWSISQWHDQYTLVCHDSEGNYKTKAVISKQQAKELIVELDLMPIQSPVFKNGKTWKKI